MQQQTLLPGTQHITLAETKEMLSSISAHVQNHPHAKNYAWKFEDVTKLLLTSLAQDRDHKEGRLADLSFAWKTPDYKWSYLPALEKISNHFDIPNSVIFAPGHGNDVSHCEAFLGAKGIINLDIDPVSVDLVRTLYVHYPNIKSILGLAEYFSYDEPTDLILMLRPCFNIKNLDYHSLLRKGGFVACNGNHIPEEISHDSRLIYRGTTVNGGQEFLSCDKGPAYIKEAQNDREFYDVIPDFFSTILSVVSSLTGQTTNIIENYHKLRIQALEVTINAIRAGMLPPEIEKALTTPPISRYIKKLDIFNEQDLPAFKDILMKYCPFFLDRKLKTFILPPLIRVRWGARNEDLALFQAT